MQPGSLSPETHTAAEVARLLQLAPLVPEGGYFRRTAESDVMWPGTGRRAWSVIYMLITPDGFSALHRLGTDEVWSFLAGDPLESLRLAPDGSGKMAYLGSNPAGGEIPLDVIPAQIWQGTRLRPGGRWALVSNVVAPEFLWSDFELGGRVALTAEYPAFSAAISTLTR